MERKTGKVSGFDVDLLSFSEAVEFINQKMRDNKGLQIVTINPEIIELALNNKELSEIIQNSQLVVPDSFGIKLAFKLKGINQEQIAGIDLAQALIKACESSGYKIALAGAKEDVIQSAVKKLKSSYEKLDICFFRNGYFSIEEEDDVINNMAKSGAKLVLIAMGAPKQEFFIKKCMQKMPESVFMGVGGTFDVWSGKVERAPEFFRSIGCEWLYRTIKQPERIKRIYKTLPVFLFKAIMEAQGLKKY